MTAELTIAVNYDPDSGQWNATASRDGSPEYDTGGAVCRSPEAALYVLALELYRELGGEAS